MNDELLQPPKGFRDYPPEEAVVRRKILSVIEGEFKNYGFLPMQTSSIQNQSVLTGKFANSEDTDVFNEIYLFEDRGGRKLGLRYDLTVPLGRILASNPKMSLPFKRYEIGTVWRDGPVKTGRLREFTQCDADIIGVEGSVAEAELFALAQSVFAKLGVKFRIEFGNRKVLESLLQYCGINDRKAMITIDKLKKIGVSGVEEELKQREVNSESIGKLRKYLDLKGVEALQEIKKIVKDESGLKGVSEVEELIKYCEELEISNAEFTPSLARGLDYYTGNVFEFFLVESEVTSSIGGGGRYENLVKNFGGRQVTATGMAFGLDVLFEALKKEKQEPQVRVMVIPIKNFNKTLRITKALRDNGIPSITDYSGKSLSKNLDYASRQGIPFTIIAGEQELKENKIVLRNMKTGEEKKVSVKEAVDILKNFQS